ncbi:helix-turn-helix transcriptional regulator [Bacillus paranthracis]|uniref:helix-turn-helix domain-containing protein n=1 Tax=Bacillus cereus group TaxID=86661 RepID=UPI001963A24A|nr:MULTISPECIES: helix-turn-helix transcriptional regulator [Bacillus cereus group]HDR7875929.1 helix-turn-helix transcriptional regulator [Bacillus mobilis]MBM6771688.1 helix-turn-helix transcriptional regulator [Bacillus cereus]MCC2380817.1 helix-turn-helix transcriptional regulator [Bacillus wiedmannii]MCC2424999.1 helix-turn-helix transcriptional regulator [Bacillus wiedmannii]MCU5514738.1 helix-turn-helix transcriptional regulator [Bacillus wiedmannii]
MSKPVIKLRKVRIEKGFSQNELAKQAEVSQSHISEIESGIKNVGVEVLIKLATVLGVQITDLIGEEEEEKDDLAE